MDACICVSSIRCYFLDFFCIVYLPLWFVSAVLVSYRLFCGFPYCLILRPGLLNRGDQKRLVEKIGMFLISAIGVDTVAEALLAAYEGKESRPNVDIMENAAMRALLCK